MRGIYAAKRLLEHGPLTEAEMLEITRWPRRKVTSALESMLATGVVKRAKITGVKRYVYRLASD